MFAGIVQVIDSVLALLITDPIFCANSNDPAKSDNCTVYVFAEKFPVDTRSMEVV